ncbi:MAG: hypothetical protein ABJA98_06540 [Acidobacteriota bacterium]
MPLSKSTLAQDLERVLTDKPSSAADAAAGWAKAYLTYATGALSTASSLPVSAPAGFSLVLGAFQAGFAAQSSGTAGAVVAQGLTAFWQGIAWVGPTAVGVTAFPGNPALAADLGALFADLGGKSAADKANDLASAFDTGAKAVIVSDVPLIQPAPPIVGPIS